MFFHAFKTKTKTHKTPKIHKMKSSEFLILQLTAFTFRTTNNKVCKIH